MSTFLEQNTATLEAILEAVNNLPEAGSGGTVEAIIDVVELPTEDINEDVFYRLLTGTFVFNQYPLYQHTCYFVEGLPSVGEPVTNDLISITAYYNTLDGDVYGFVSAQLGAMVGVPEGWYPVSVLAPVFGQSWSGVITDLSEDPRDSSIRLLLEYVVYSYKQNKWTSQKVIGWAGDTGGAEVFNLPWNKAYGYASHAEGCDTVAGEKDVMTYGQHAEGLGTEAIGEAAHSEGRATRALADYSHAEGHGSTASGDSSHAEGNNNTASGDSSHAEGNNTEARGHMSHSEGLYTQATRLGQHVQGRFNILDESVEDASGYGKYAHIVGNGTTPSVRSNAHTLDWDGLGWFAGGLKVGGTGQDDEDAEEIPTKSQVQTMINEALGVIENGAY